MEFFNSVSPFTIQTKTCRFCDSKACALKSLAFLFYPPNSSCPFSICCKKIVDVDFSPTLATATVNTNHPAWVIGGSTNVLPPFVLPHPAISCYQYSPCVLSFRLAFIDVVTSSCIAVTVPVPASSDGAHIFSPSLRTSLSCKVFWAVPATSLLYTSRSS